MATATISELTDDLFLELNVVLYPYQRLGSLDLAIEAYSKAIALDPSFLEAYVGRGNVYMDFLTEEGFTKSKYVNVKSPVWLCRTYI